MFCPIGIEPVGLYLLYEYTVPVLTGWLLGTVDLSPALGGDVDLEPAK